MERLIETLIEEVAYNNYIITSNYNECADDERLIQYNMDLRKTLENLGVNVEYEMFQM